MRSQFKAAARRAAVSAIPALALFAACVPPAAITPVITSALAATSAETVAILEPLGFFGTWAGRCEEPPGPQNVFATAYVSAAGEPGFSESLGAGLADNIYRILDARQDGENQLMLSIELNSGIRQQLTMVVDRERLRVRTLTNRLADGKELVKNGAVTANGARTPWLIRCKDEAD